MPLRLVERSGDREAEVEQFKLEEMRDFFRLHLGDDWEIWLILANAIADPGASDDEVGAAQQRAVELVRTSSPGWKDDMSELVAEAWLTLWMAD